MVEVNKIYATVCVDLFIMVIIQFSEHPISITLYMHYPLLNTSANSKAHRKAMLAGLFVTRLTDAL